MSVVIAAFNADRYVGATLESVLSQDHRDLEVIVVDDASTDGTESEVRRFPADRVRFVKLPENSGYAARPRNVGIRMASGDVVATCDADDLLEPGSIRTRVALLEKEPSLGLVFSDGVRFHNDGRVEPLTVQTWRGHFAAVPRRKIGEAAFVIAAADAYHGLAVGNFVTPSGTLYPRTTFERVGYFDESLRNGDDLEFYFRVARRLDFGYLDAVGYRYRLHSGAISRRKATLAHSRLAVLERQLALDLKARTRRAIRGCIASNYTELGYVAHQDGRMSEARGFYRKSLRAAFTIGAARGWGTTWLGPRLYERLRRNRG